MCRASAQLTTFENFTHVTAPWGCLYATGFGNLIALLMTHGNTYLPEEDFLPRTAGGEALRYATPTTCPAPFSINPIQPRSLVRLVRISQIFFPSAIMLTQGCLITSPRLTTASRASRLKPFRVSKAAFPD